MLNIYRGFEIKPYQVIHDWWEVHSIGGLSFCTLMKPWLGSVQECVNWIDKYYDGGFC